MLYGFFYNLPRDTFQPLKEGTSKLHAHWKWSSGNQLEQPSYFLHFLGQQLASRISSVDPLEFQWKPCHSMYMDLFEEWTTDQLHDAESSIMEQGGRGCGFQVRAIRMIPLTQIDHESFEVKTLLNCFYLFFNQLVLEFLYC